MEDVIRNLYYGNLCPSEKCSINSPQIKVLANKICKQRQEIINELTKEQKDVLEQYNNLLLELHSEYCEQFFTDGFKLGAQFIIEIYAEKQ